MVGSIGDTGNTFPYIGEDLTWGRLPEMSLEELVQRDHRPTA